MNKKAFRSQQSVINNLAAGSRLFLLIACGMFFIICFLGMDFRLKPKVYIKELRNRHYQLIVEGRPYFVNGVCYNPTPIGEGYEYDLGQDKNEPWIVDGKLMRDGKINTVRFYKASVNPEGLKKAIAGLYKKYGVRTILGHWLGFWEYPYPRYADPEFRAKIKKQVLDMVETYKDEEGILLWVLGNENNYSFSDRVNPWTCEEAEGVDAAEAINIKARIYYSFVNEVAREIHKLDPDHPVVMANGEALYLDIASKLCPDIDIIGVIIYRGKTFGNIFNRLREVFDKPLLFIEFGADAYNSSKKKKDQEMQSFFLESQWREIYRNSANYEGGAGNCLGGTLFEWSDEWWKHNPDYNPDWYVHDTAAGWSNGSYYWDIKADENLNMNEEWFGIVGISQEKENGVNERSPRQSYYDLRELWDNPQERLKIPLRPLVEKTTREPIRGMKIW